MLRANERPGGNRGVVSGQFQQTDPITTTSPFAITPLKPLLSVNDLLELLQVSRRCLERMRSTGAIPPPDLLLGNIGEKGQLPRFPRWRAETIAKWIESGGQP
jgi:hypothetical protein